MADVRGVIFSLFLLTSPLLCIAQTFESDIKPNPEDVVPVLMWSSSELGSLKSNENLAFGRLESEQFESVVVKQVSKVKPLILLFIEENLSSEDFIASASPAEPTFSKLQQLTDTSSVVNFYPSVHAPLSALKKLKSKGYKWIHQTLEAKVNLHKEVPTILEINLNDVLEGENRQDLLARHNEAISKFYGKVIKEHKNILAIYTGRFASWNEGESHHRVRRLLQASELKDTDNGTLIVDKDNKVMLYYSSSPVLNISASSSIELKKPTMITSDERNQMQRLIVTYSDPQKVTLRFRFNSIASGYWSFGDVEVMLPNQTEVILSAKPITIPFNFSYHCSAYNTTFKNSSTALSLKDFQIQPFLSQQKFNEAYDCVYFFTIPILSGLFVTTLLAMIMSWGLCMILDIKTMDRFDDPKGKTISINVSE